MIVAAELTWTGERFEHGVAVRVEDGRIAAVGPLEGEPDERLAGRALLPGFVNAHSHAFQRGLRGRGETFAEGAGSFWSWREAMYALVERMDPDAFRRLTTRAFNEMRAAGITCVGEFHYLHHADGDDYAFDEMVLEAAREAGIRIVLLNAYYATGGIGRPLEDAQLRFRSKDPDAYWAQMDRLVPFCEGPERWLGAVVHSVRAASQKDLASVYAESRRRGIAFHMHMEEQPREIEECRAVYGLAPMELLLETVDVGANLTCVHCTHTDPASMKRYRETDGQVCLCPLTEANLGDGLADVERIGAVALGTDSNARISMLEEMRWLEYGQRLRRQERGVFKDSAGRVGAPLLRAATEEGARALGVPAGRIAPGCWADFVTIDLDAPSLAGWTEETLVDALAFGAGDDVIAGTCVAGRWALD